MSSVTVTMDTVELQWPAKISVNKKGRRGFGGAQYRTEAKFTPLAHWERTEEHLESLDKTLGPVSPKKEAQSLVQALPDNAKEALKEELKLYPTPPTTVPRKRKHKENIENKLPKTDDTPAPLSIFAKKSLKTP